MEQAFATEWQNIISLLRREDTEEVLKQLLAKEQKIEEVLSPSKSTLLQLRRQPSRMSFRVGKKKENSESYLKKQISRACWRIVRDVLKIHLAHEKITLFETMFEEIRRKTQK